MGMLDFHTQNVTNTQETVYAKNCREGSRGLSVIFQLDGRLKERHLGSFQSLRSRPTAYVSYPSLVSTDVHFPWLPGYLIFIAALRTLISLNFFFWFLLSQFPIKSLSIVQISHPTPGLEPKAYLLRKLPTLNDSSLNVILLILH